MSLAVGTGPFSRKPLGRFDFEPPKRMRYVEDYPRRVRGSRNGALVLDSLRVKLLIETGGQPQYCFPEEEANGEGEPAPGIDGYVVVDFDAVDTWHEFHFDHALIATKPGAPSATLLQHAATLSACGFDPAPVDYVGRDRGSPGRA